MTERMQRVEPIEATAEIGVNPAARPKFPKDDGFQAELRRRVAAYFRATGKPDRDCWQMYLKTAIILAWCAASYWLLVFVAQTWWQAVPPALSWPWRLVRSASPSSTTAVTAPTPAAHGSTGSPHVPST